MSGLCCRRGDPAHQRACAALALHDRARTVHAIYAGLPYQRASRGPGHGAHFDCKIARFGVSSASKDDWQTPRQRRPLPQGPPRFAAHREPRKPLHPFDRRCESKPFPERAFGSRIYRDLVVPRYSCRLRACRPSGAVASPVDRLAARCPCHTWKYRRHRVSVDAYGLGKALSSTLSRKRPAQSRLVQCAGWPSTQYAWNHAPHRGLHHLCHPAACCHRRPRRTRHRAYASCDTAIQ